MDIHCVRDKVTSGEIDVRYISTDEQLADLLMKALPTIQSEYLTARLNLIPKSRFTLIGGVRNIRPDCNSDSDQCSGLPGSSKPNGVSKFAIQKQLSPREFKHMNVTAHHNLLPEYFTRNKLQLSNSNLDKKK